MNRSSYSGSGRGWTSIAAVAAAHELAGQVPLLAGLVMAVVVAMLACRVWGLARGQSPGPRR